jgi:hypothetical protein
LWSAVLYGFQDEGRRSVVPPDLLLIGLYQAPTGITVRRTAAPTCRTGFQPGLGRVFRPVAHAGFSPSPALWDAAVGMGQGSVPAGLLCFRNAFALKFVSHFITVQQCCQYHFAIKNL